MACGSVEKERTGVEVYQTFCVHCHQSNGKGVFTRYPPLDQSKWLSGDMPIKIVLHGLKGPVEVKGETYNNVMAPWGEVLTDLEIARVITYVRSSWSNVEQYKHEAPCTKEDVQRIRKDYPRTTGWTSKELKADVQTPD